LVWFLLPGVALLTPWFQHLIELGAFEFLSVTSSSTAQPIVLYDDLGWLITLGGLGVIGIAGSILRLRVSGPLWALSLALLLASSYQPVAGSESVLIALMAVLVVLVALSLESIKLDWLRVTAVSTLLVTALASGVLFGAMQPRNFEFGIERQVPALILAAADVEAEVRTLKIVVSGGVISGELIWGDGRSQEEFSLLYDYFRPESEFDSQVAQLTGSLIAGNPEGVEELVRALGVDFVLVQSDADSSGQLKIAIDSLSLLQSSGETSFGSLWSVVNRDQSTLQTKTSNPLRDLQLLVIGAFGLLAVPTPASISGRKVRRVLS
jgi:hypothetical protein